MKPGRITWVALSLWLLPSASGVGAARAQSPAPLSEPDVPEKAGKELRAFRIRGTAPRIDGRLDDETWNGAQAIEDFVQDDPDNMQPPTERTVVRIAYDDRYLYIAAHCYTRTASQIRTGL